MFDNIGGKIKGLAKAIFWLEAVAAVIAGIVIIADSYCEEETLMGLMTMLCGPLIAWVSSWFLYGFGELIEKASEIAENTRKNTPEPPHQSAPNHANASQPQQFTNYDRIIRLDQLRAQGLISDEEYQQAISKNQ